MNLHLPALPAGVVPQPSSYRLEGIAEPHLHACQPHISNSRFGFVVARTQSYLPERGADFEQVLFSTASR